MDDDAFEFREAWSKLVPEPPRQVLARGVLEPRHVVQVVVVEQVVQRLPNQVDIAEVDEPARFRVDATMDAKLDFEAVTMQARALVTRRHLRQAMGGLEAELTKQTNLHARERSAFSAPRRRAGVLASGLLGFSAMLLPLATAPAQSGVPLDMLPVPAGSFIMGTDSEGEQDERPAHSARVSGFLLDLSEVTNADYEQCVKAKVCRRADTLAGSKLTNGRAGEFKKPDHPVVGVSWSDAKTFCEYRGKRLPREVEWERAARGSDGRRYVWGNDEPDPKRHGVFGGQVTTRPVRRYPEGRGPYGHFDLAGNVWEWVADEYDPYAYRRPGAANGTPGSCAEILETQNELRKSGQQGFTGSNPIPAECERVLRGGAYNYRASGMRASNRVHHPGTFRIAVAGFRCAKDHDSGASKP